MKTNHLNNLAEKIIKTIEEKKIKPRPKWEFVLKNYFIWAAAIITLIIGGLAFAVIIYLIRNSDWEIYQQINSSWLEFIILSLPYFWLLTFMALIAMAYYNFKHTKSGYKYRFHLIVVVVFLLSLTGGSLFYVFGLGEYVDKVFEEQIPVYHQLMAHRYKIWQQPENGFLAGEVEQIISPEKFKLEDLNGNQWLVSYQMDSKQWQIKPGLRVKIIGKITSDNHFQAEIIKPFGYPHKGIRQLHGYLMHERKK